MSTSVVKGSKAWLEGICEALASNLVGIEMDDNRGQNVSPQVQVKFLIERYLDTPPLGVHWAVKFEGFRGIYPIFRGRERSMYYYLAFDFQDGSGMPEESALVQVSDAHNLTYAPNWLNSSEHFSRLSDALRD